jgi:hypothetical protein
MEEFKKKYNVGDVILLNYIYTHASDKIIAKVRGKITDIELFTPIQLYIGGIILDDISKLSKEGGCEWINPYEPGVETLFGVYNDYFDKYFIENLSNPLPLHIALKKLAFMSGTNERLCEIPPLIDLPLDIILRICILINRPETTGGASLKSKSKRKKTKIKKYKRKKTKKSKKRKSKKRKTKRRH